MGTRKKASGKYEAAFAAVENSPDVQDAVEAVREIYSVDHVTYHLAHHGSMTDGIADSPYVKSTYPASWLTRYLLQGYTRKDPVAKEGFTRMLPFDWRELTIDNDAMEVFDDFTVHGLGGLGYSIPIVDKRNRRGLFTFNTKCDEAAWDRFVEQNAADLAELSHKVHAKAIWELHGEADPFPKLGPRELECLLWAAQGKTMKETARLIGVSDTTVRDYLTSARLKLESANITQAIAKAVVLRLIRP